MTVRCLPLLLLTSACVTPGVDEESRPLTGTTIVSLTFDDTLADQYQVGGLLSARGLVGTFYVNSPRLTRSGSMTLEQARTLQQLGNEIGGHTLDHVDLTTVTEAEMIRQVCDDRDALLAMGFTVTSFAYPYSADNLTVQTVVKNCNYNSARDNGGLLSPTCVNCPPANPIPPTNPYQIHTNSSVQSTATLETLQGFVTHAEQGGGGWVPITFHHICDGCASNGISPALLTEFLDWLAPRESLGTEVATVHQVIGGDVKPPVSQPAPPDPSNLLKNPSLEVDANGDQVPDCWYRGGSGTNSATFTLVSNAADGNVAQRIDMTSYTDGARRLVSRQDSGTCAPAAMPGHTYTMRAAYYANIQPIFSVYYRDTAGTWKWFSQSPRLPTSTSYVTAQYTSPPLPADATAISVGLAITSVGFIVMDAYSLVDDQAAPPPPPPPPTNLLINPSLEINTNGDQVPDCWQRGRSGKNTATFTLVPNAADGNVAQRIDMTSYRSGARRLVSRQDAGTCAPPVTPGHTYTMRAAYIANTPPIFSVYYRDTAGTWRWWRQSPPLPTSSSYVTGQYTTPPLPADATAISVGLSITNIGFIIMDAYSLVDDQAGT